MITYGLNSFGPTPTARPPSPPANRRPSLFRCPSSQLPFPTPSYAEWQVWLRFCLLGRGGVTTERMVRSTPSSVPGPTRATKPCSPACLQREPHARRRPAVASTFDPNSQPLTEKNKPHTSRLPDPHRSVSSGALDGHFERHSRRYQQLIHTFYCSLCCCSCWSCCLLCGWSYSMLSSSLRSTD